MTSLRQLERLLWIVLAWMGLTTLWVSLSLFSLLEADPYNVLDDGNNDRYSVTLSKKNRIAIQPNHQSQNYLWTSNPVIPAWMKEYMDWHSSVVPTLTLDNWDRHKYLILRCFRKDERCGGVSDRLKPVPLVVLAAQRSKRILFIDWDRPCPLSEFLVPPPGGFQWNPPSFLLSILQEHPSLVLSRASNLIEKCMGNTVLVQIHIHDTLGGMTQYDGELGTGSFQQVYHDLFRIFFVPSPGVQRLIDLQLQLRTVQTKDKHNSNIADSTTTDTTVQLQLQQQSHNTPTPVVLVEGEYSVAHYRAEYGREVKRHPKLTEPSFIRKVALNAIRCASELQPNQQRVVPIYFASDNPLALETARELATTFAYPIVTFSRAEEIPLQLDSYTNDTAGGVIPSDYYSTFVDLYVAGSGKCVTHGRGGFGRFASLLSFNVSCSSKHVKQFYPVPCQGRPPFRDLV
jgi:hypothetical protein